MITSISLLTMLSTVFADVTLGKGFVLDGELGIGYAISSSFKTDVNGVPTTEESILQVSQSRAKLVYNGNVGITWENKVRPYFSFMAISGMSADNTWNLATSQINVGAEYFVYRTSYGALGVNVGYTRWSSKIDASFMGQSVEAKPTSHTVVGGLVWRF